jgi:hypothetical protein
VIATDIPARTPTSGQDRRRGQLDPRVEVFELLADLGPEPRGEAVDPDDLVAIDLLREGFSDQRVQLVSAPVGRDQIGHQEGVVPGGRDRDAQGVRPENGELEVVGRLVGRGGEQGSGRGSVEGNPVDRSPPVPDRKRLRPEMNRDFAGEIGRIGGLDRLDRALLVGVGGGPGELLFQLARELELPQQPDQGLAVGAGHSERFPFDVDFDVCVDGDQFLAQEDLIPVLEERLPLALRADLGGVRHRVLDGAEPLEERSGALLPDAGGSGDVVGTVALETQQVDDVLRRHAEQLPHLVGTDQQIVARGVQHERVLVDQLHHVLVDGDDEGMDPGLRGAAGERPDHVVGLLAGHLDRRDRHGPAQAPDVGELLDQIGRHPLAGRLVLRIPDVTGRRFAAVEDHRDVVGRELLEDAIEHQEQAVGGVGRDALAGRQAPDRVVGAEDLGHRIDEHQDGSFDHR